MGLSRQVDAPTVSSTDMSSSSTSTKTMPVDAPPPMPPPPYFKTDFINPSSFKAAVDSKLDKPSVSLFRLSIRLFQLIFALASGTSYAIELSNGNGRGDASGSFVFSQVTFSATIIALVINGTTVRYYRFSWIVDWVLTVFWLALFATFYKVYLGGAMEPAFEPVNIGRMERAVWCDLVNALLWFGSAVFSSAMCYSGIKGSIQAKLRQRQQRKETKKSMETMSAMETGII